MCCIGLLSHCAFSTVQHERGDIMALTLKAARVNVGLTRPEVKRRLEDEFGIEISVNTLASYENKITQPNIETGKALASIFGMSVDDIIFL